MTLKDYQDKCRIYSDEVEMANSFDLIMRRYALRQMLRLYARMKGD